MSKGSDTPAETDPVEVVEEAKQSVPWTTRFRKVVLIILGSMAFIMFLGGMWLRIQGGEIAYQDLFLLLATAGTLLSVNFGLDLLGNIVRGNGND